MTSIILNGANGKMCENVFKLVENNPENFKIVLGIDPNPNSKKFYNFKVERNFPNDVVADVVIDFSNPNSLDAILSYAQNKKTPIVIATTGYSKEQIEKIKNASKNIPIFFTFNMSLGINLLISLVKKSYNILKNNFDIEIIEKHHNQKIDAPSGTALMIADAINEEAGNEFNYVYDRQKVRKKREKNEIGIHSIRGGTIVGEHEVIFSGEDEMLKISHIATSKKIFALGALKAAEFIKNKSTGIYNMKDLINFN